MLHLPHKHNQNELSSSNKSHSLYSHTRNSFSRSIAVASSYIMSHKTHTKTGDVTKYGFLKGFIQASRIQGVNVYIEYHPQSNIYQVLGYTKKGDKISKSFNKITYARAYLKSFV